MIEVLKLLSLEVVTTRIGQEEVGKDRSCTIDVLIKKMSIFLIKHDHNQDVIDLTL
jgi:hypothetical protein